MCAQAARGIWQRDNLPMQQRHVVSSKFCSAQVNVNSFFQFMYYYEER